MLQGLGIRDWGLGLTRVYACTLALLLFPIAAWAQPLPPELTRPVNDFANIIDPESEAELERRILELKRASGDVVVVATIDTFQPGYADINEYAVRMFENRGRGIGDKGKDNGALIVLAVKDRRVRVEVGYDLEQFLTDQFAGDVSRTDMAPYFSRGEYGAGLLSGASRIIGRVAQGRGVTLNNVPMPERQPTAGIEVSPWVIFLIIVIIMLMSNSGGRRSRMRRGGPYWGGGNWSGWDSGVGPFGGGGGRIGGGGFGGGFGGFGGGRSGGGGGGAGW